MNPAADVRFTRPLIRDLQEHVDAFARSMVGVRARYGATDAARPAAVAWVYLSVLAAWAEDHGLVDPYLRAAEASPRDRYTLVPGADSARGRLARAFAALCAHPSAWGLLDPRYNPAVRDRTRAPSEEACADLTAWWGKDAPSLAYPADAGPASITGWLPGDLLQAVSDTRRKGNALAQTPWWVCNFILGLTLTPAAREFRDQTLRVIDPACGTGHFLVQIVDQLWELYTTGSLTPRAHTGDRDGVTGWTPVSPVEAARRILAGVDGCELDPLTAAVARLRVTVTLSALMRDAGALDRPLRLDAVPPWVQPRIVVGDSLLAHKASAEEYAQLRPEQAAIINLGTPFDRPAAGQLGLFGLEAG